MHKQVLKESQKQFIWGWLFLLPTIGGLIVLNIIPIFQTIWQSFYKTGAFGRGNQFIGFANYVKMYSDKTVTQALLNTFKYAIIEVPFSIFLGLIIAVLLNTVSLGRGVYRTIFFLPMVAAPAAVAMVWRWLYNYEFGLLNYVLTKVGLPAANWLSNPNTTFISIAFVGIWSILGYNIVILLAGLQEIPIDFYEAAEIDGAGKIRQFFNITIPQLFSTIFFVFITRTIAALQIFDSIYVMLDRTNESLYKTQSLVYLFYKYSFQESNKGYGATIVLLQLVVIIIITLIQIKFQKKYQRG